MGGAGRINAKKAYHVQIGQTEHVDDGMAAAEPGEGPRERQHPADMVDDRGLQESHTRAPPRPRKKRGRGSRVAEGPERGCGPEASENSESFPWGQGWRSLERAGLILLSPFRRKRHGYSRARSGMEDLREVKRIARRQSTQGGAVAIHLRD